MSDQPFDDGLALPEVGRWARRKYHFLSRYLTMFATGMKNKWPERHYIDLFASAGLAKLRDGGEIVESSTLLAARVPDAFTGLHLCEREPALVEALKRRLAERGAASRSRIVLGDVNQRVDELLRHVPSRGALSVAFADPYGLHLDFETVAKVAAKRCDLIILLADNMDALRNWAAYYQDNPTSSLDRFMGEPGWREVLAATATDRQAEALRNRYCDRLRELGYLHFGFERVQNSRGRDIYTLVYASRSPVGLKFWNEAAKVDEGGQRSLW
jgi:three-Cys-motif partner protein